MKSSLLKTVILSSSIFLFSNWLHTALAADADELTDFLDELLAEEPGGDEAEVKKDEDTKDEDTKTDAEKTLDKETWEDHESAQEILDEDEKWTYAWWKKSSIAISDSWENNAKITITKVLYDWSEVLKYRIYYSEKTLASQTLSLIKDTVVTKKDSPNDANMVEVELKNLVPNTKYYVVVSPVHPEDDTIEPLEVITKEASFTTKAKATAPVKNEWAWTATAWTATAWTQNNNTPKPTSTVKKDYIKNITNTVKDNEVVLRWNNSEPDVDKVEVTLRHTWESKFTTIGTPKYKDGMFTFKVTKVGTYFLKLKALDAQWNMLGEEEYRSTVKVASIKDPAKNNEQVVTNPPKVWPTTDLLLALLIFSMIMYMVMRFRRLR